MTTLAMKVNPMNTNVVKSSVQKIMLAATVALTCGFSALASAAEPYEAGKDYAIIANPGPLDKPNKIEVREFFWYGCPHCFRLDPFVTQWLKTKPADVNFVRTPAAMNPTWEQNARGFYAVELMGKQTEAIHHALFSTIHERGQQLFDQASLASFYASQGVDATQFNGLYNSFAVSGKIAQSKKLATQYQLEGVPAVVVDGKYVVQGEDGKVLQVVNYLIDKERHAGKK